ncbi:MAG: hypothetical protein ACC657_00780 [Thiohalomonadales bacterium]
MSKNQFEELDSILEHLHKIRKYYWIAAILFWLGAALTMKYYITQTGTDPSWIPGILMFAGAGLYFVVRIFNDY